jgi:hypothetical protein
VLHQWFAKQGFIPQACLIEHILLVSLAKGVFGGYTEHSWMFEWNI